jgi:hypothetical protein
VICAANVDHGWVNTPLHRAAASAAFIKTQRSYPADATVDEAVAAFIRKIESMSGKWDAVAPAYIVERAAADDV